MPDETRESALRRALVRILTGVAAIALFLVVHNYGVNLLPMQSRVISPEEMIPEAPGPSFAYWVAFREDVPDQPDEMRSRVWLWDDDRPLAERLGELLKIQIVGGGRFAYLGEHIVFATALNDDPRTNGHIYRLRWPMLRSIAVGRTSVLVLAGCALALLALRRRVTPGPLPPAARWSVRGRWLAGGAAVVFASGLYCNTGTLAPYAITFNPYIDPATGYAYNQDHVHFRVLHDFVDGQPRSVWDKALLLRRILYPVITYPAMKLLGFEAGGVAMNLGLNVAMFVVVACWLRRRLDESGALFACWLFALYPGFSYWVGQPYQYALIAPGSLLLMMALVELDGAGNSWRRTAAWSLVMGLLYLAYDFAPIFLPATLLLLLWRRRWRQTILAATVQVLPLVGWLLALRFVFGQSLGNSNASVYGAVLDNLRALADFGPWLAQHAGLGETAAATFFGANFVFLPALFLGVLVFDRRPVRARLAGAETAVIVAAAALFLIINLGAKGGGWNMSGSWIARLYQPVFPAFVFYLARWWQTPPLRDALGRTAVYAGLALVLAGNALVVFGPVLRNPLGVSGEVFYRFYLHSPTMQARLYDQQLRMLPRRTFGFGQPTKQPGS